MAQKKKPTKKAPARKKPAARKTGRTAAAPEVVEAAAEQVESETTVGTEAPPALPEPEVPEDTMPEALFAARTPPPEPERPRPLHRRAIFFDVENTSRAGDVAKILEHVAIDRSQMATELVASGNWRVIGNETARLLAKAGAHLVHSAPATGVRDWSDLRIAVAAGVWLASARPGDQLDIVSDDKAFDVVGDVAATLGVFFRKLSYRALLRGGKAAPAAEERGGRAAPSERGGRAPAGERAAGGRGRRTRGGRGRAPRAETATPVAAPAPVQGELIPAEAPREVEQAALAEAPAAEVTPSTGQAAPADELLTVVHELLQRSPNGVMLDVLAKRLKEMGFERPPGSPRLVTRVRSFRELDVSPRGLIRLKSGGAAPAAEGAPGAPAQQNGGGHGRRRRRGGRGRGRGGSGGGAPGGAPPAPAEG